MQNHEGETKEKVGYKSEETKDPKEGFYLWERYEVLHQQEWSRQEVRYVALMTCTVIGTKPRQQESNRKKNDLNPKAREGGRAKEVRCIDFKDSLKKVWVRLNFMLSKGLADKGIHLPSLEKEEKDLFEVSR